MERLCTASTLNEAQWYSQHHGQYANEEQQIYRSWHRRRSDLFHSDALVDQTLQVKVR